MFPIGRHPAVEWVVAEAVASGCTDVAMVTSPPKQCIQEYLVGCSSLNANGTSLTFLVQPEPLGLGHALLLARDFCEGEPFAVLLPDDLCDGPQPPLVQMEPYYSSLGGAVFAITVEDAQHAARYGRLHLRPVCGALHQVEDIGPRVKAEGSGSVLVGVGRYLLSPRVWEHAAQLWDDWTGDELDDGMIFAHMIHSGEPVHAVLIRGRRYDISTPDGYVAAWQRFGEEDPAWTSH
jgi:UTP--glucose-1-phosphate uridylyltransferase